MQPKVSVIVPVYGVEKYIRKCAISLFNQTYKNIEYIFVNDCTKDKSIDILKNVIREQTEKHNVKIIDHKVNKGLPAARKTGVEASSGDYIVFCDSDDWVETNIYEELLKCVENINADIAFCSFLNSYDGKETLDNQFMGNNTDECIRLMLTGKMHGSVCNKIYKKSLFNDIYYPIGFNNYEDLVLNVQLFNKANTVTYISDSLYHYRMNSSSMSRGYDIEKLSKKIKDTLHNTQFITDYLAKNGLEETYRREIKIRKAFVKNYFYDLMVLARKDFTETFPEANEALSELSFISRKTRIMQKILLKF